MWVSVPLVILVVLLGITGAYFTPRQERLAELAEAGAGPEYAALAVQVARVAFAGRGARGGGDLLHGRQALITRPACRPGP